MKRAADKFERLVKKELAAGYGIAASVRYATTFTPEATAHDAGEVASRLGLNRNTFLKQFAQARKEDVEIEACTKGMTREQFIEAVVRCVQGK